MKVTGRSYQGQDTFVLETLGCMRGGYFLDFGASDGLSGSNSFILETDFDWDGICIEPNEKFFAALSSNRRCLCLNCCIYDRETEVTFLEQAGVYGGIYEAYESSMLRFVNGPLGLSGTDGTSMRARSLRSVLREANVPEIIDYWSLDVEGAELAILESFPFDAHRFRVLTVEHNNMPVRERIYGFLVQHGYIRVRDLGIDDGYICDSLVSRHEWRSAALSKRH